MTVTGASSGPLISTCSGTPSSASTVRAWPRSWPSSSPAARSGRSRSRPTAIFSAAMTAPAPAASTPTASPPTLVSCCHLAMRPPARLILGFPGRCYPSVASRDLAGEAGHDLIRQRAQGVGPLLGRRLAAGARAEQDDLVPSLGGQVTQVQDGL